MRKTFSKSSKPNFTIRNAVKMPSNLALNQDSNEWASPVNLAFEDQNTDLLPRRNFTNLKKKYAQQVASMANSLDQSLMV